ncbi:MFS transporter [Alicyclobacillus herbarius]|uniref:MFS transporter n=1 Tax=Alicyclobacillus herbarius TaxID=122960 RepID=UPI00041534FC|nr:MFS transporter [Alicyclobacillus herbarius]
METWRRNLAVLWIGCLVTSASFSMVVPFLPLFLIQIGVHTHTEMWSGLLYSVAFVAGAISSPFWGSMADKYGRKPMIVRAGFVLFVVYTLTAFTTNPYEVLGLRILQGLLSGYIPGSIALVGTNTPENKVGYALSMISAATATGGIIGPLIGGGIAHLLGNRIAFASAGLLVFCSTLLVIFWVREEKFEPTKQRTSVFGAFRDAWQNKPLLSALGLNALTAFSIMTVEPVLTLYVAQLSGSMRDASLLSGVVFSLAGIASVVFAPMWGKLADKTTFRRVLLIGLVGGGVWTLAQIPFHQVWTFALVRFIYGAFFCAVFPAINGLVVRCTTPEFRGRAFGLNQTANQIGNTLGPLVGGWIGGAYSIHSLFWCTGGLLLLVAGVAWFSTGRQSASSVHRARIIT